MTYRFILFILLAVLLNSCVVEYRYSFETELKASSHKTGPLEFRDSLISVALQTSPVGIGFTIENLTTENIFIEWTNSYMSLPDGNTFTAMNFDLTERVDLKYLGNQPNQTIIPAKRKVSRFTCSTSHMDIITSIDWVEFRSYLRRKSYSFSSISTIFSPDSYWLYGGKYKYGVKKKSKEAAIQSSFSDLKKYIERNNSLGIGFTIRKGDEKYEYHFPIEIVKAICGEYNIDGYGNPYLEDEYETSKKDNWTFVKTRK